MGGNRRNLLALSGVVAALAVATLLLTARKGLSYDAVRPAAATSTRRCARPPPFWEDRIQIEATGRIDPENWTHGSSAQRRTWYLRRFELGDPNACDTFSGLE